MCSRGTGEHRLISRVGAAIAVEGVVDLRLIAPRSLSCCCSEAQCLIHNMGALPPLIRMLNEGNRKEKADAAYALGGVGFRNM